MKDVKRQIKAIGEEFNSGIRALEEYDLPEINERGKAVEMREVFLDEYNCLLHSNLWFAKLFCTFKGEVLQNPNAQFTQDEVDVINKLVEQTAMLRSVRQAVGAFTESQEDMIPNLYKAFFGLEYGSRDTLDHTPDSVDIYNMMEDSNFPHLYTLLVNAMINLGSYAQLNPNLGKEAIFTNSQFVDSNERFLIKFFNL